MKHHAKHAYSNILKILSPKNENFQMKNAYIYFISAQNINCGYSLEPPRRGGSNEYPQSMFLSRNKKNNVYPYKPQFYYIKVGFKRVKIIWVCFRDDKSIFTTCRCIKNCWMTGKQCRPWADAAFWANTVCSSPSSRILSVNTVTEMYI